MSAGTCAHDSGSATGCRPICDAPAVVAVTHTGYRGPYVTPLDAMTGANAGYVNAGRCEVCEHVTDREGLRALALAILAELDRDTGGTS